MRQAISAGLAASMIGVLVVFLGAGTASATYLKVEGNAKHESVTFKATLAPETSTIVGTTDEITSIVKCARSELHASTEKPFIGDTVTAAVSALSLTGNCNMTVHKMGVLHFEHIDNSTNATVISSGAEITAFVFGLTLTCKTGTGSDLGTLTGVKEGHATLHLYAVLNCGFLYPSVLWKGTYKVTSPTGLGASSEDTTLEVNGSAKEEALSLETSLKAGTSTVIKSMTGELINTCTGALLKWSTTGPYAADEVHGNVDAVAWSGCSTAQGVAGRGSLSVVHVPGSTDGTVISSGLWIVWKGYSCKTNRTPIGTLTGVKEGHATMDVDAVLNCGESTSVRWEATYTVTSPTGLGVTS